MSAASTTAARAVPAGRRGVPRRRVAASCAAAVALLDAFALTLVFVLPLAGGERDLSGRVSTTAFVLGMTGLTAAGVVLVRRGLHLRMGWLLTLAGLTGVLSRVCVGTAIAASLWSWPGEGLLGWTTNWSWVPGQALALLVVLRFPDGTLPGPRWRYAERLILVWAAATTVTTAVYPGALGVEALAPRTNPLGIETAEPWLSPLLGALFTVMPLVVLAGVAGLVVRWRRAEGEQRQQLAWVAAATGLIAAVAPFALLSSRAAVLEGVAYLVLPAAIAVAVLRFRLWDLGLVVRRTLVYLLATVALAALYVGLVAGLSLLLGGDDWVATVAGALLVAGVAVPVRTGVQRALDRFLFGNRRDPYAVVRDLGARLEATGSDALAAMTGELVRSLRLPYVAVETTDGRVLACSGAPTAVGLRLPLLRSGRPVGRLVAGQRTPGEALTPVDVRLLEDLAGHAAVAVQAALLDEELRHSYARLLTVRDGERSRLRRELHDGLGPVLGAVTMRAEAARNMVRNGDDPASVDEVLAGIGVQTESAVHEVRRLLDELRPLALEDTGLTAALVAFAAQYVHGIDVRIALPDPLPDLAPEVEAALFRATAEALRNAAGHSGGRLCTVRALEDAHHLVVEVADDGTGLGGAPRGVGLTAMEERMTEVGGRMSLAPSEHGGLAVRLEVPREAQ